MKASLNGGRKGHPLSEHAKGVLDRITKNPEPAYRINPGVRDILLRKGLVVFFQAPLPSGKMVNWIKAISG